MDNYVAVCYNRKTKEKSFEFIRGMEQEDFKDFYKRVSEKYPSSKGWSATFSYFEEYRFY